MAEGIEPGKYLRLKDHKHVWVLEILEGEKSATGWPLMRIRRPKGAYYAVFKTTTERFLANHKKVE